jgi:hypothetical protein
LLHSVIYDGQNVFLTGIQWTYELSGDPQKDTTMRCTSMENANEAARRILALYRQLKARPGHLLKEGYFFTHFAIGDLTLVNFRAGCDLAIQQSWIKETDPGVFMLTPIGFTSYH